MHTGRNKQKYIMYKQQIISDDNNNNNSKAFSFAQYITDEL